MLWHLSALSSRITMCIDHRCSLHPHSLRKKGAERNEFCIHFSLFIYNFYTSHFKNSAAAFFCLSSLYWNGKSLCLLIPLNVVKSVPRGSNTSHYDWEHVIAVYMVGGCSMAQAGPRAVQIILVYHTPFATRAAESLGCTVCSCREYFTRKNQGPAITNIHGMCSILIYFEKLSFNHFH